SPMTHVLARGLSGELGPYPGSCALGCHSAGEPGLLDGGFAHVAEELGHGVPEASAGWDALPRRLRRVGGVTCTTCHGPGAVPERSARWAILRSDVCATCHDAPPRYSHAASYATSAMAR